MRGLTHSAGLVLDGDGEFYFVACPADSFEPRGQIFRLAAPNGPVEVTFVQMELARVGRLPIDAERRGPIVELSEVPTVHATSAAGRSPLPSLAPRG